MAPVFKLPPALGSRNLFYAIPLTVANNPSRNFRTLALWLLAIDSAEKQSQWTCSERALFVSMDQAGVAKPGLRHAICQRE